MKYDVIIIGAGVLGLSAAYHLSMRKKSVLVLEKEILFGQHASGKNAGMFRQLYRHPQLTEWATQSRKTWPESLKEAGFKQTGSIIVGRKRPSHNLDLFAEETEDGVSAVYTKTDGLIDPGDYINQLFKLIDKRYCNILFQSEVQQIDKKDDQWNVLVSESETFHSSIIINAAGAWAGKLATKSNNKISVKANAYARHLWLTHNWEADYMPNPKAGYYWDESHGWYMRVWDRTSRLLSICDKQVADPDCFSPNPEILENFAKLLTAALPTPSKQVTIGKGWHCFRFYTDDQLPIWGFDQRVSGLFWLAAFGGFGMSTSFAAAQAAVDAIYENTSKVIPDFCPSRVEINNLS